MHKNRPLITLHFIKNFKLAPSKKVSLEKVSSKADFISLLELEKLLSKVVLRIRVLFEIREN